MKKSLLFLTVVSLLLLTISTHQQPSASASSSPSEPEAQIYTNKEASDCFTDKALQHCAFQIKNCTEDPNCSQQLSLYQSCAFGTAQAEIFNGYCFRKWKQNSFMTRNMVNCLIEQCNLLYNSEIGVQELFQCSQQIIAENYQQCGEVCATELNKIRDGFKTKTINELFAQNFEDESAKFIVNVIKKNCILENKSQSQQRRNKKRKRPNKKEDQKISDIELDKVILLEEEKAKLESILQDQQQL